jgi:hypothetical protein
MKSLKIHKEIERIESEIFSKENPFVIDYVMSRNFIEKPTRP